MNTRRSAALVLFALAASIGFAAGPASAATTAISPGESSYDRPSIVNLGPNREEIAWAGTDTNGEVNYAVANSSGAIQGTPTTDTSSATYPGTGVTLNYDPSTYSPALDFVVIAWTDLSAKVHVGLIGNGIQCESTDFGYSVDTPTLAFAANSADQSEGVNLYLTTVDSGNVIHVTQVQDNNCANLDIGIYGGANTLGPGTSTAISGQTTWDGPTLLDTTPNSSPSLYHGGTGEPGESSLGGNCAIYTSGGYVNGGVDVTYDSGTKDSTHHGYVYLYPNVSSQALILGTY